MQQQQWATAKILHPKSFFPSRRSNQKGASYPEQCDAHPNKSEDFDRRARHSGFGELSPSDRKQESHHPNPEIDDENGRFLCDGSVRHEFIVTQQIVDMRHAPCPRYDWQVSSQLVFPETDVSAEYVIAPSDRNRGVADKPTFEECHRREARRVVLGIDECSFVSTGQNVLRAPNTWPLAVASAQSNPAHTSLVISQHCVGGMVTSIDLRCLWLRLRGIGGAAMAKADKKLLVVSPCRVHSTAGCRARY